MNSPQAADDPADVLVGDRMIGYIRHLLGDQSGAREHIERMLAGYVTPVVGARMIRFVFDQRATARCFLARVLWLQGFPDRSMRLVEDILQETMDGKDTLSICQALVQAACPVAIFAGDTQKLELYVDMLVDHADRNALGFFSTWGRCFKGVLLTQSADVSRGIAFLREALVELRKIQYGVYYGTFLGSLAESLARIGDFARGRNVIDEALDRSFLERGILVRCRAAAHQRRAPLPAGPRARPRRRRGHLAEVAGLGASPADAGLGAEVFDEPGRLDARFRPGRGRQRLRQGRSLPLHRRFGTRDLIAARAYL